MADVRLLFEFAAKRVSPPWLRRLIGGAVMESFGVQIDTEVDRNTEGVNLRFPNGNQADALGLIGQERRIIRGIGEGDFTFAARLREWWDAHRIRGNAYALLGQMHAYFLDTLNVPIQVVANSGTRVSIDTAGVITRDSITWNGDGNYPTKWARVWIFLELSAPTYELPLLTESGEPVLTEDGETILASVSIFALSQSDIDSICAVPREWSAAHIDETHVILLFPGAELWGYQADGTPVGTWADTDPSPGQVWQSTDPVDILC